MHDKIEKYKEITIKMIDSISNEIDYQNKVASLLEERQIVLDSLLTNEELIEFRVLYKEYEMLNLDNQLRDLLTRELNQAKTDILEQKKKKAANFAYSKVNREGFNFFSTQI